MSDKRQAPAQKILDELGDLHRRRGDIRALRSAIIAFNRSCEERSWLFSVATNRIHEIDNRIKFLEMCIEDWDARPETAEETDVLYIS